MRCRSGSCLSTDVRCKNKRKCKKKNTNVRKKERNKVREGKKEGRRGEKEGEVGLSQSSVAYLWCKRKYLVLQGIQFTSAENAHVS